jgi:hypothetical protein
VQRRRWREWRAACDILLLVVRIVIVRQLVAVIL